MCNRFVLALATYFLLTQPYLLHAQCQPSGYLKGTATTNCNTENDSECCEANKSYPQYKCSPQVTSSTKAIMTLNSFAEGGDGGDPSACDERYHDDSELVVALSTGWYSKGSRCGKNIRINGNGRSVLAKVVDECDSVHGCDSEHSYQHHVTIISLTRLKLFGINWGTLEMMWDMLRSHGLMPENY